jgi:hypothetical protein
VSVHSRRWRRDDARCVLNRDDRRHAEAQRHDTHEGEGPRFRQRPDGMNRSAQRATGHRLYSKGVGVNRVAVSQ